MTGDCLTLVASNGTGESTGVGSRSNWLFGQSAHGPRAVVAHALDGGEVDEIHKNAIIAGTVGPSVAPMSLLDKKER